MRAPWLKYGTAALLVVVLGLGAWVALRPKPKAAAPPPVTGPISFEIRSTPPDATVLNGSEMVGTSNSQLHLPPGQYQLTVRKDGYQPATVAADLRAASPAPFNVTLSPLPPSLHLITPFNTGTITLDDKPSQPLGQDGQFAVPALEPGKHTLKIESGQAKAAIAFEVQPQALPVVSRPDASGIDAVAVATFRDQAVLASSIGDLQIALDNQNSGKLKSGEATLQNLAPGAHPLSVGTWSGNLDAGPAPIMSVYLASLASQGRLNIEIRGAEDAHIFVNGADRGTAQKGRSRLSLDPGDYEIRVARDGFLPVSPQKINVRKGSAARLTFVLVPRPVVATPAPTELPVPPKLQGTVTLEISPPSAEVRFTRTGENNYQVFHGPSMELEPGSYAFVARAPGYLEVNRTVEVAGGTQAVRFSLTAVKAPVVAPTPVVHTMRADEWDKPWTQDDIWYTRQGGDFVLYKITPTTGTFQFAISPRGSKGLFGGNPKVRWVIDFVDPRNYLECELDKQSYASAEYRNGKKTDHTKRKPHGITDGSPRIQITIDPNRVLLQIYNKDHWEMLDEWSEFGHNFSEGRFGFHLPNQDQMFLTDFKFTQPPGSR